LSKVKESASANHFKFG
jgi:hypothetical protein